MTSSPAQATADLVIPGYELLERIGSGGFGEVFRARHLKIQREVAIKLVHTRHASDPAAVARFLTEARAVNKVRHRAIVEIFDVGELADGRPYCVMELVPGETLRALLASRGHLPLAEAMPLLAQIAAAIDAAHEAGIAHRDLKPDNVFVLPDGSVKLIDFGLAKLVHEDASVTQTGQVFGTPLYMSPEQCRGRGVTVATDRYSFGALAYHVLVGAPPFSGEPLDLAVQHINDPAPPPSTRRAELPAHVDAALLALLAKDPDARPATCSAAIDRISHGVTPTASRTRRFVTIIAVAAIALGASIVVALVTRERTPEAQPERWSSRRVRFDIDGITTNPTLTWNGRTLIYGDDAGWWQRELDTGATQRLHLGIPTAGIQWIEAMPDTTFLVSRSAPSTTELVDPRSGTAQPFAAVEWPALSPDGNLIAAWDASGWLVVIDRETRALRRLTQRPADTIIGCPPRWSPDGTQLLWGRTGFESKPERGLFRTYVTAVSDGATTPLTWADVPFRNVTTSDYYSPIAFLTDGRVAYCNRNPVEVRARALWGGPTTTLATLDSSVSDCMIAARGDTLAITLDHSRSTVGVIDLPQRVGQPALLRQLAGPFHHLYPQAADAQRAIAIVPRPDTPPNALPIAGLRGVDLATGDLTPLPTCDGEDGVVIRGGTPLHVRRVAGASSIELLDFETCAVVDRWTLPAGASSIALPACGASWCVVGVRTHGIVSAWKLVTGQSPALLAELSATQGTLRTAISHDEQEIALAVCQSLTPSLHRMPAAGGPARRVELPVGMLDGVAWDDARRLLIAGQAIDDAPYSLVRISADGTRESLWSSKSIYLSNITTDAARRRVVGVVSTWQQELLVVEPAQGNRSD